MKIFLPLHHGLEVIGKAIGQITTLALVAGLLIASVTAMGNIGFVVPKAARAEV